MHDDAACRARVIDLARAVRLAAALFAGGAALAAAPTIARADGCGDDVHGFGCCVVADLGLHVVSLGCQRTVACRLVLQASTSLYVPWTVNDDVLGLGGDRPHGTLNVAGWVLRARPFVFPLGHAPTGLWFSPYLQGAYVRGVLPTGGSAGGFANAEGLSVGYTFAIAHRLLVALGAGAQFQSRADPELSPSLPASPASARRSTSTSATRFDYFFQNSSGTSPTPYIQSGFPSLRFQFT